jgi:hypothetical protein
MIFFTQRSLIKRQMHVIKNAKPVCHDKTLFDSEVGSLNSTGMDPHVLKIFGESGTPYVL